MKENKGFSLVELIVVVAIMAVLVGILAPAYLSYVEKTRIGADEDAAEEIRRAVETACAEVKVYDEVSTGTSLTIGSGTAITSCATNGSNLQLALEDVFGSKTFKCKSKKYNGRDCIIKIIGHSGGSVTSLMFEAYLGSDKIGD